jgi:6,7-dimethyl-8-ribityllumazine synthase
MLELETPISFGVLTVENEQQALERASVDRGNKGAEAAITLFEMLALKSQTQEVG